MQSNAQASKRQSVEMKNLTAKIAALTEQNEQTAINASNPKQVSENIPHQRYVRPTPQNQQRYNYARDLNTRIPQGSATGFSPRDQGLIQPQ